MIPKCIPAAKTSWHCFNRQFVLEFLTWLEETRGCSKQTQRQRLAAIRSFIQYGGILDVCTVAVQADVEKIKFRKPPQKLVHWLTKEELAVFLSQPDGSKKTGLRDMVFLTVMYDTAARCQELIDLKIQDLCLMQTAPCIYLTGKGNKTRVVPLLPKTAQHLRAYLDKFHPAGRRKQTDYVFFTHSGPQKRMSEDAVAPRSDRIWARRVCRSCANTQARHAPARTTWAGTSAPSCEKRCSRFSDRSSTFAHSHRPWFPRWTSCRFLWHNGEAGPFSSHRSSGPKWETARPQGSATIAESGLDTRAMPAVFLGGGAALLKRHVSASDGLCRPFILDDVCLNAKGYEHLVGLMSRGVGNGG